MGLIDLLYSVLRNSPLGSRLAHAYPYNFRPHQLAAILGFLDEAMARHPEGDLAEVGCFFGHSSIFLATHVAAVAPGRNYRYHAYDTFGGFVDQDVDHELKNRSLPAQRNEFEGFRRNDVTWVQQSIDRNASNMIPLTLHKVDASSHHFEELGAPVFILIDVDLYRPTWNALQRLWPKLAPGSVIVLDDCSLDESGVPVLDDKFSGGHAALLEFAGGHGLEIEYAADKLAVIRR